MSIRLSFVPFAIGLMLFPSPIFRVILDGADIKYYGFPLPWNSDSPATSLGKDIYLIPLVFDVVFYCIAGFFIWKLLESRITQMPDSLRRFVISLIWTYGLVSAFLMWACLMIEPFFAVWYYSDLFDAISVSVRLGTSVK